MASPQLENGFTRVANEILTVTAATRFSAAQLAIVMCVWRYTYSFNRKAHEMSESFLAGATGISIRHIKRELSVLLKSKVLICIRDPTIRCARVLAFNKDYSQWQISPRVPEPDLAPGDVADTTPDDVLVTAPDAVSVTQERNLKENIKTVMCMTDFIEHIPPLEEFILFWTAYPRRQANQDAFMAFSKLKPDKALFMAIIDAVKRQSDTEDWQREGGRLVPLPASYLSSRRWEDEPGRQAEPKPKHRYLRYYQEGGT